MFNQLFNRSAYKFVVKHDVTVPCLRCEPLGFEGA